MESVKELLKIKSKRKELSQIREEVDRISAAEKAANAQILSFLQQIKAYISSPNLKKVMDAIQKQYKANIVFQGNSVFVFSRIVQKIPYQKENLIVTMNRAGAEMEKSMVDLLRDKRNIPYSLYLFFQCYLTLWDVSNGEADLSWKSEEVSALERKIGELAQEISCKDEQELVAAARKEIASMREDDSIIKLGNVKNDVTSDEREWLSTTYGLHVPEWLPLCLSVKSQRSNIFLERKEFADLNLMEYLEFVYFESLAKSEDVFVELAAIENSNFSPAVLSTIYNKLSHAHFLKFYKQVASEKESSVMALLSALKREKDRRNIDYLDKYSSLEDFNRANPYVKKNYILLVINGFSSCISTTEERMLLAEIMKNSYRYGIFVLLIGENCEIQGRFSEVPPFDLQSCGADWIPYAKIQKQETEDIDAVIDNVVGKYNHSTILYLDDMLKNETTNREEFIDSISVPVGLSLGKIYHLDISANDVPGGFIIGMSRSGKSAFIHTFILSTCAKYTDREVEFYLIDFKGERSNTFDKYEKNDQMDNLYAPNVKYLSLTNAAEDAYDVITMIEAKFNERQRLFHQEGGIEKLSEYNKKMSMLGREKLPMLIFIIDEYNNFLRVDESGTGMNTIGSSLENILKTVASVGIKVFFSGQNPAMNDNAKSQVKYRICFDPGQNNSSKILRDMYGDEFLMKHDGAYERDLMGRKGYAYFYNSSGDPVLVRTSFAGDGNSSRILSIAKKIRSRYTKEYLRSSQQMQAGSDTMASLEDALPLLVKNSVKGMLKIPLGLSSSNRSLMNVEYTLAGKGKVAFGENIDKLFRIEDTLITMALSQDISHITYVSFAMDEEQAENEYLYRHTEAFPNIFSNVSIMAEGRKKAKDIVAQAGNYILTLYEHLERRRNKEESTKQSYLLIIHGVSTFANTDNFINKLKEEGEQRKKEQEEKKAAVEKKPFPTYEQVITKMPEMTKEKYDELKKRYDMAEKSTVDVSYSAISNDASYSAITKSRIQSALHTLFHEGNKYGIYLLLADISLSDPFVSDITSAEYDEKKSIVDECVILLDRKQKREDNTCYLHPNSKVMIFDTSEEHCAAFFENRKE